MARHRQRSLQWWPILEIGDLAEVSKNLNFARVVARAAIMMPFDERGFPPPQQLHFLPWPTEPNVD